jgi:hypothetical protein
LIEIVNKPISIDLLQDTWFAMTVESSVAVECTLNGIPCFLCKWLETKRCGYVDQYTKFGAGYKINSPDDIERIPELLETYKITKDIQQRLWQAVNANMLDHLLSKSDSSVTNHFIKVRSSVSQIIPFV